MDQCIGCQTLLYADEVKHNVYNFATALPIGVRCCKCNKEYKKALRLARTHKMILARNRAPSNIFTPHFVLN